MGLDNKSLFYNRLIELSNEHNLSINQVEKELDYPRNSLNNYNSKNKIPSAKRLMELSKYFEVSPEYLSGRSDYKNRSNLEFFFEHLDNEEKKVLFDIANTWYLNNK